MVTIENVKKFVLDGVSLHIPKGECVGIIGTSGAGKTTLLKLVCGLLTPECGSVRTLGLNPVDKRSVCKRELGAFFVGVPVLEPEESVGSNFQILRDVYDISKQDFLQAYEELAFRLGFLEENEIASRTIKNLSMGQRMRVELAAILLPRPKLLLLDEPDVGLDENGKAALGELLKERCKQGMTVLMASHNLEAVSQLCTRIILLHQGRLIYYGSGDNLRRKYAPVDTMTLKVLGKLPDLEDLPLRKYSIDNHILQLSYNSNHITAAEILKVILQQTEVSEVTVKKFQLEDIIVRMEGEERHAFH